jgi:hypothetical protein
MSETRPSIEHDVAFYRRLSVEAAERRMSIDPEDLDTMVMLAEIMGSMPPDRLEDGFVSGDAGETPS